MGRKGRVRGIESWLGLGKCQEIGSRTRTSFGSSLSKHLWEIEKLREGENRVPRARKEGNPHGNISVRAKSEPRDMTEDNKGKRWDFPGSPIVRTPCFHCRGHGFDPWSGH